ncbi:unnamed protein product [Effrenium voratum]|nr:unnamed protein product [Effrenium voratum]
MQITEEKLKLLLKRLQMPHPRIGGIVFFVLNAAEELPSEEVDLPQRSRSRQRAKTTALEKLQEFPDIAEEAEELKEKAVSLARREREADQREVRLKNQMEEMRAARRKAEGELTTRLEEEEARHSKTQMLAAEFKAQHLQSQAELSSIVKTLRHEWQELAAGASEAPDLDACALLTQFLRLQSQVLEPKKGSGEKELKEVTRLQGEVVQAQQLQARAEWQLNQLQAENQQLQEKVQQLKAQAEAVSDSCPHCGRKKGEASVTPVNISFQAEPSHQEESAISASAAKAPSEVKASAEVDKEPVAHGALRAEPSHQQESAISASAARAPLEVKASAEVDKEPVAHGALRAEPSHQQESAISASAARAPSEVTERTVLTEEPNGGIFATEVNVGYSPGQGAENQALRREVARLERVLNDVQEQLRIVQCQGGAARELACWQSPGYHISKALETRQMQESLRQAEGPKNEMGQLQIRCGQRGTDAERRDTEDFASEASAKSLAFAAAVRCLVFQSPLDACKAAVRRPDAQLERKKALQESTQQARECEAGWVLGMFRSQHPWPVAPG